MTSEVATEVGLAHVLYRSNGRVDLTADDIRQILAEARARNGQLGLTGCLHYEDGLFFQWLEGPQPALDIVMALLRSDPRHNGMTVLSSGPIAARHFTGWSMHSTDRERASLMDWFAMSGVTTVDRVAYASSVSVFLTTISG